MQRLRTFNKDGTRRIRPQGMADQRIRKLESRNETAEAIEGMELPRRPWQDPAWEAAYSSWF